MPYALIVDDDKACLEALDEVVRDYGFETSTATSVAEAVRSVRLRAPDLMLLDLYLPDGNSIELLRELQPSTPGKVVLITGHASVDTAVDALRMGVDDYLTKPLDLEQMRGLLERFSREITPSEVAERAQYHFATFEADILGDSKAMTRVHKMVERVAMTDATVFVIGETGTGKELVARNIHNQSKRRDGPFIAVNCAALSPNLLESELFGHEKGSFTGATRRHRGFFERATGGTLLLDEITEMSIDLQAKLLRVLETGRFLRVGGDDEIATDARVIAATNRLPEEAVKEGKLRQDLLYRLSVFPIHLPPLRDRSNDVLLLADHFLGIMNQVEGTKKHLTSECRDALLRYSWPGNVRELQNLMRRAFILAETEIGPDCFFLPAEGTAAGAVGSSEGDQVFFPIGSPLAEAERRFIIATLEHCGGHRRKTAEILGISPKTLYNRLIEYKVK